MSWAHRQAQEYRSALDFFPAYFRNSHPRTLFDNRTSEFFLFASRVKWDQAIFEFSYITSRAQQSKFLFRL